MSILYGPLQNADRLHWRFQGFANTCWLSALEMMMQWKHGNIYGVDGNGTPRTAHADYARATAAANRGSFIMDNDADYGLVTNYALRRNGRDIQVWRAEIWNRGPVLAEGNFGWARIGRGAHVIVIVGVSRSGQLAYYNPNIMAVLPHPQSHLSYMTCDRCMDLATPEGHMGPFWQCA